MEHFNFVLPYSVRVGDINYGGHVSNAVVLLYFQDARIGYLQRLGPYSEHDIGGCGIILPEARAALTKPSSPPSRRNTPG
jgi:acyl-CoA thioesterase FadM